MGCYTVHKKSLSLLISLSAAVNKFGSVHDLGGNCALMGAVCEGDPFNVRVLLDHGAQIEAAYGFGGNAVQTASFLGHIDVLMVILAERPDIDVNDTTGSQHLFTPLCMAMQGYWGQSMKGMHVDIIILLVRKGAKLSLIDAAYWQKKCGVIPTALLKILHRTHVASTPIDCELPSSSTTVE